MSGLLNRLAARATGRAGARAPQQLTARVQPRFAPVEAEATADAGLSMGGETASGDAGILPSLAKADVPEFAPPGAEPRDSNVVPGERADVAAEVSPPEPTRGQDASVGPVVPQRAVTETVTRDPVGAPEAARDLVAETVVPIENVDLPAGETRRVSEPVAQPVAGEMPVVETGDGGIAAPSEPDRTPMQALVVAEAELSAPPVGQTVPDATPVSVGISDLPEAAPVVSAQTPAPSLSIGRIDVVFEAPPTPPTPPAARKRADPVRTQGFDGYDNARLGRRR